MMKEIRFVLARSDLTCSEKAVLIFLQACAGERLLCYPSLRTIARGVYLSVRQVNRIVKELERKGWIEIKPGSGKWTNVYKLKIKERMGDKVDERILERAIAEAKQREEEIQNEIPQQEEQNRPTGLESIQSILKRTQNSYWAKISGLSDEEIEEKRQIARKYLEEMKKKASG
ncbi:MAG: hypothetical protein DRP02_12395 [Candidatus Gerdarchaeota archaeon]|nr:MAG: hypothetical protein DRP02_12395 [Candidatus Gerdarchaeota archaeon]